jgi:malonate-semialdehyde dehydrogenase (acetylating) / methylmalonate-semialdehyde dehydrogenase
VITSSAFGAAGQRCLAGSVAVIVGDQTRQDEVRDALAAAAAELAIGSGASPETEVCPMVAPEARERAEGAIARAVEDGARLVLDGRIRGGEPGTFLGPTIVDALDAESELAREELFGPILALVRVPDLDAALSFANGSRYGNAGAIFTSSGRAAHAYSQAIQAGMIGVNIGVPAPVAWFPFAGWKDSCLGDLHANGSDAVDFYTRKKVVTARW